uniref:Uncharacterized protein n=1 Tax=Mola mola TaxID=94237 RepID=A0A3Q3WDR8_MOLML
NVSALFETQITPSGWTFNIWSVIYVWSPAVLPYGFFISWCINLCFNIGWLLLWDRMMIPALVFLILVIATNYSMVYFICHGLHSHGAWLNKNHVQNGVMIYTTWTHIATLINLTIVFVVEQFVLDEHVRYIFIIYPVVIWALAGNLDKHYTKTPSRNGIFIGLLAIACLLYVLRIILVVWRHFKQP